MSYNIVSSRRRISSKSTPVAAGGACDGPAPRSSKSVPPCFPLQISWSHHGVLTLTSLPSWQSLWLSTSRRYLHLHLASVRCHICTYKQTTDSISIYIIYIWTAISTNTKHTYQPHQINIPRWSKTSPGGSTMSGSSRKSTPA
jgi:hypothetical protein